MRALSRSFRPGRVLSSLILRSTSSRVRWTPGFPFSACLSWKVIWVPPRNSMSYLSSPRATKATMPPMMVMAEMAQKSGRVPIQSILVTVMTRMKGQWPFMRVITVTKIDWIGKRHIFWAISAITIIGGMVAFVARGDDKYDIEFRGGTQITFQLRQAENGKPGVHLTRDEVERKIKELKTRPGLKDLDSARIYGVGPADKYTFEMQTTILNPKDNPSYVKDTLLVPLADHLKDILNSTLPVKADNLLVS